MANRTTLNLNFMVCCLILSMNNHVKPGIVPGRNRQRWRGSLSGVDNFFKVVKTV